MTMWRRPASVQQCMLQDKAANQTRPADPISRRNKEMGTLNSTANGGIGKSHKGELVYTGCLGLMMRDALGECRLWLIAWHYKRAC